MIGGNVFSIAFGRNLDAHAPSEPAPADATLTLAANATLATTMRADADASHQCLQGRECYAGSLAFTIAACTLALALSLFTGWRDWRRERRLARAHVHVHVHTPAGDVVWDEDE